MAQSDLPSGVSHQAFEVGDQIALTGVAGCVGVNSGSTADFTGDWTVTKVVSKDSLVWEFDVRERGEELAIVADLHQGWNHPAGNLRH